MENSPQPNAKNSIDKNSSKSDKLEKCPRCDGLYILNKDSGEMFPVKCKSYNCEYCGEKQRQRLYKFMLDYLRNWNFCRLFTFTFRENIFFNVKPEAQLKLCSEVWRRFIIYWKRSESLSKNSKEFAYVKTTEFQKNGSVHYHAAIDRFFPLHIAHSIWNKCINQVFNTIGINGNVDLAQHKDENGQRKKTNLQLDRKEIVKYILKYIVKSVLEVKKEQKFRRWSKNKKGSIFPPKIHNPSFAFVNCRNSHIDLGELSLTSQSESSEMSIFDILDFDFFHDPDGIATDEDFFEVFL